MTFLLAVIAAITVATTAALVAVVFGAQLGVFDNVIVLIILGFAASMIYLFAPAVYSEIKRKKQ